MTNKRNIGIIKLVKSRKYQKYEDPVAIPEPCPDCPDCPDCDPCPECGNCSPEGTYCEGDGFATCQECQQAWCQCQQDLELAGCDSIPLAPEEAGVTVLEHDVQVNNISLTSVGKHFKIQPIFYTTDIDFDIIMVTPLGTANVVRLRMRYGQKATSLIYDFEYIMPVIAGQTTHVSFPNIENQTVYLELRRIGSQTTLIDILPTLVGANPFANCTDCVTAYADAQCTIPAVPLADPEDYLGQAIEILQHDVQDTQTIYYPNLYYYKIHVAEYTDTVNFYFYKTSSDFVGTATYYIKFGSVATPSNYDYTGTVPLTILTLSYPNSGIAQDVYITYKTIGGFVSPSYVVIRTRLTLNNHPPFENCGEAVAALELCQDELATCESDLIDCQNTVTDLENEISGLENNLIECYETVLNCATENDFVIYWSGGVFQATDVGGGACITSESWGGLWGDEIFQNPNICNPAANPTCDLFGNFCYCSQVNNLNTNCNGFIITSPCGTSILTREWLYITIASKTAFYLNIVSYSKVEVSNAPSDIYLFDCYLDYAIDGMYYRTYIYWMDYPIWSMPMLVDAEITFSATINFPAATPSPRTIEHKVILYLN